MEINLSIMTKDQLKKFIVELEEENKKLKKELELVRKNTRANVETLDLMYGENVDLKKENEELKEELKHWEEGDYCYDYFDED